MSLGASFPRDQRGRDDDVDFHRLLGEELHLRGDERFAHHLGVSALSGALFLEVQLEELAAHALDLLLDLGTCVESADDCAEATRRADRSESCDAAADHQHLGGRHAPGGCRLSREQSGIRVDRFDHGAIAGEIRHRAQRVHLLGAGDAGNLVHRDRRDVARGELLDDGGVLSRPDEADEHRPFADQLRLVRAVLGVHQRLANLQEDVHFLVDRVALDDRGAGLHVGAIRETRSVSGIALDDHFEARAGEGVEPCAASPRRAPPPGGFLWGCRPSCHRAPADHCGANTL